jgi:glycosyltransferase involved in cell wall biosynthesis
MKILQIHNHYGGFSGESSVLAVHKELLEKHGHTVKVYSRSSEELYKMPLGSVKAFFWAFYNRKSIDDLKTILDSFDPDIVHIHNLFPIISPAILPFIKGRGKKIVMTVHNYRLVCPNGLFFNDRGICEKCAGGREWQCALNNCESSMPKSVGYFLRNAWARMQGYYSENVDAFLCLTDFQRKKLVDNGFPADRCHIYPNFDDLSADYHNLLKTPDKRKGILFIGRLNRQKGADFFVQAAGKCPDIPVFMAGHPDPSCVDVKSLPPNVRWLGAIDEAEKYRILSEVRCLAFTSRSYEGFPMVFLEAMKMGLPVIAPNLAGYPEIIREGINGRLFKPGDVDGLARVMRSLHDNLGDIELFGNNGRRILQEEYSVDVWYKGYMELLSILCR